MARIRFLTAAEGGRSTAPLSGVRPQIRLGNEQSSCLVEGVAGQEEFPLGETVEVRLRPLFAEFVAEAFASADRVALYEGRKLVAVGEFIGPAD